MNWLLIALILVLPVIGALLWGALTLRHITGATRGARIPERAGGALLLIDLQKAFWTGTTYPAEDLTAAETAIRSAVEAARARGWPVIALRQEWSTPGSRLVSRLTMGGTALAGGPDTALAPPFAAMPDHVLVKRVQDGFETGALDGLLQELDIGRLEIAGLDGAYCVARTAQAALNRGYQVTLIENAILTADSALFEKTIAPLSARGLIRA